MPAVPLPDVAVLRFDQIPVGLPLIKEIRLLGDIGVDPDRDVQALAFQPVQHALWIGKHLLVPLKIAPVEFLHPKAVEMEHMQRNVAFEHPVNEAVDRLFIVAGRKRGGEPQPVGPSRRQRRFPRQLRVIVQHFLQAGPADNVVFQRFAGDAELDLGHDFGSHLVRNAFRVVHKHAVAVARQIERHVFVSLLAAGSAVFVP
ncbi:hypothetical protein D1872_212320 [compost metagenome]